MICKLILELLRLKLSQSCQKDDRIAFSQYCIIQQSDFKEKQSFETLTTTISMQILETVYAVGNIMTQSAFEVESPLSPQKYHSELVRGQNVLFEAENICHWYNFSYVLYKQYSRVIFCSNSNNGVFVIAWTHAVYCPCGDNMHLRAM